MATKAEQDQLAVLRFFIGLSPLSMTPEKVEYFSSRKGKYNKHSLLRMLIIKTYDKSRGLDESEKRDYVSKRNENAKEL